MTSRPTNTTTQLAVLTSMVDAIARRLDEDREDRKVAEKAAQAQRDTFATELRHISDATTELSREQTELAARIAKIEPVTNMVTGWRFMALGATGLLGIIGGGILALVKMLGVQILPPS